MSAINIPVKVRSGGIWNIGKITDKVKNILPKIEYKKQKIINKKIICE